MHRFGMFGAAFFLNLFIMEELIMKFTKILALALAVLMLTFCFAACNNNANTDDNKNNTEDNTDVNGETPDNNGEETPDVADDETKGDDAIDDKTDDVIVMATNAYFKPYEYYEGDKIIGIDAEIAEAIAEKLGKKLEISDMAFDSIITSVNEGAVDFGMAGMTVTEKRLESVDFTSSYANGIQSVIVKEDSPITTVDDLFAEGSTYKAGVQLGTTGDSYASGDLGADRVVQYANANEAVLALAGGSVDCVIIDNEPAKALVAENEGLKILETSYADEDYAICVKKGNTELLDALNKAIDELTADGTIDKIVAKYIG